MKKKERGNHKVDIWNGAEWKETSCDYRAENDRRWRMNRWQNGWNKKDDLCTSLIK